MSKKIYVIAGEASGDLYGSQLVSAANKINPNIIWQGWGGEKLKSEKVNIDVRYEDANFMGFIEVAKNILKILSLFRLTKKNIIAFKPDAILLIDYPGFNLRMAKWAKNRNIPVYFFIAPQVWAWKESRIEIIRNCITKLFIILPFEKKYFEDHQVKAFYFGHPLMNIIQNRIQDTNFKSSHNFSNKPIFALLPGSRLQEIEIMLPVFLEAAKQKSNYQIAIAGLVQHKHVYEKWRHKLSVDCHIIYNNTYSLLQIAELALVTSGTATLETGLFGVPQIVCYKGNALSYQIAKRLIKVKYISLVNLIMDKQIVPELIQDDMNSTRILEEITKLEQVNYKSEMQTNYNFLHQKLYFPDTFERIAHELLKDI